VHGRPYLSFCHNSASLQLQVLVNMQMDAYLKKEQIGTLFVRVGAPEGSFGGRGEGGSSLKCADAFLKKQSPPFWPRNVLKCARRETICMRGGYRVIRYEYISLLCWTDHHSP